MLLCIFQLCCDIVLFVLLSSTHVYSNDSVTLLTCINWKWSTLHIHSYSPNNTINSKKNNGSPLAAMPRFYDSEEEGAGSLGKQHEKQLEKIER